MPLSTTGKFKDHSKNKQHMLHAKDMPHNCMVGIAAPQVSCRTHVVGGMQHYSCSIVAELRGVDETIALMNMTMVVSRWHPGQRTPRLPAVVLHCHGPSSQRPASAGAIKRSKH
jgi:hypothetical protein